MRYLIQLSSTSKLKSNSKHCCWKICRKKERKTTIIPGGSIEKFYMFSIGRNYTVKSNPNCIIIQFLANNLKVDDSPEAIAEKNI